MAGEVVVTHTKVNNNPDDPVTAAQGGVVNSDWNANHTLDGMTELLANVRDAAIINMSNDDYTMTDTEATAVYKVLINVGSGKTLTYPSTADDYISRVQIFGGVGVSNDVTLAWESGGTTGTVYAYGGTMSQILLAAPGTSFTHVTRDQSEYARNYADGLFLTIQDIALAGSPGAGLIEYRDDAFYGTTTANNRGVIPSEHITINQAQVSLNDDTNAQSPFASGADTLTLPVGTYFFDAMIAVVSGSNSHTTAFGIAGTATIGDILYEAETRNGARGTAATGVVTNFVETASATAMNTATAATNQTHYLKGQFTVTVAGTIIPQITFSAAPGSTNTCETMSYFKVTSIGAETTASVGAWA